nr:MAG TPA: hypothetical protein [Caudoviricetes sp.]
MSFLLRKTEKFLSNITQNFTNVATKLSVFFLLKRFRRVFISYDKLDIIYFSIMALNFNVLFV